MDIFLTRTAFWQLDERNERVENKSFLENYLNTELSLSGQVAGNFSVSYFDSACNKFVQIADYFLICSILTCRPDTILMSWSL